MLLNYKISIHQPILPMTLEINGQINIALLKQIFSDQIKLQTSWVKNLILKFKNVVKNEPNILRINDPAIIIGDIHGQFFDLMKILSLCPSLQQESKYHMVFLGDYVDRGPMGMQVILLLMAIKLTLPKRVILLRGNHESRQMTRVMNFCTQACTKYSQQIYLDLMDAFDALPLVCVINQRYLCVHGGITADGDSLQTIQKLNRFDEIPLAGTICDLMWADPVQDKDGKTLNGARTTPNHQRNCSIIFGRDHAKAFLKQNKLVTIIRAHEAHMQGYFLHNWPNWNDVPMVYSIFSAPNYCGNYGNLAALLTIRDGQFNIRQFKESNPKYYVPAKFNAFNFTVQSLLQYSDKIVKRMVKNWVAKCMPELKHIPQNQLISIYLTSELNDPTRTDKSSFFSKFSFLQSCKPQQIMQMGELQHANRTFRKSMEYYKDSEKRPAAYPIQKSIFK